MNARQALLVRGYTLLTLASICSIVALIADLGMLSMLFVIMASTAVLCLIKVHSLPTPDSYRE